jgi:Leucine-rich repeat (LRR) protein
MKHGTIFLFLIFILFLFIGYSPNINAQVLEQDSLALVALYDSTDGENWNSNENWLSDSLVGTWSGITVLGGRVTEISLSHNNLQGTIPDGISNLTGLTYLDLMSNQLSGSIPSGLGDLTNLLWLSLDENQLDGTIPSQLGQLTNLFWLSLRANQLSGSIPPQLGNLASMWVLSLDGNQLTGAIPSQLGNLTGMMILALSSNQLSGSIPPQLGNLTAIQALILTDNQLSGTVPSQLGNPANLATLYLSHNQLSGAIPSEFSNLAALARLYINDNSFTGLPDLSSLTELDSLYASNNQFTFEDIEPNIGIENFYYSPQDSVGEAQNIVTFEGLSVNLSVTVGGTQNQYQWYKDGVEIPGATGNSYTIDPVSLSDSGSYNCQITNTVATELTLYSRKNNITVISGEDSPGLVALYDSTNGVGWINNTGWLAGPIAGWYGITVSNDRVTEINLANNNLVGNIPGDLASLDSLETLNLLGNRLREFPDLSSLAKLINADISGNQFTFEDIEPNIGIESFVYSPQDSVGEEQVTTLEEGQNLNLEMIVGGAANQYRWFKNNVEIDGADSSTLVIESLTLADSGSYRCEITNDIATALTLYSRPVDVHVTPSARIADPVNQIPKKFALLQNYPNPFNPVTTISYAVAKKCFVKLSLYDMLGREVITLVNRSQDAGNYSINFNAGNLSGGLYFYKLQVSHDYTETKKMLLVR